VRETWSLVAMTAGTRAYWMIAALITTVITARFLGPEGRGVYVAAVAWVTLFSSVGNLSLSQVVVYLASGKPRESWLGPLTASALSIVTSLAVIGWVVVALLFAVSGGRMFPNLDALTLCVAFTLLPFMLWIEVGNNLLLSMGRLKVMNLSQMIGATSALALTFAAVGLLGGEVRSALLATTLAQAVAVAIGLTTILRSGAVLRPQRAVSRELITGGLKLHLNAIGTYLFAQSNILILNQYRSPEETAYFQLAMQLFAGIQIVPAAVSSVAYSMIVKEGPDAAWPRQRNLMGMVIALMIGVAVIASFAAPWLIPLAFGDRFVPAVSLFRILLLAIVGMTMSVIMASQWIARGLFLQSAFLTLAVGCAAVVANFLAIPRYGAEGAAWAMVGTYTVATLGSGIMALWVERRYRAFRRAQLLHTAE
jgi:O-antigen/teichoic acid export membrane protein